METQTEIIQRTFEAKKYPVGSKERLKFNLKPETSEYMTSYKFIVREHFPETETHYAYKSDHSFETLKEAKIRNYDK